MNDSISRADAIRWVKTECNPYGKPTLDFESGKKVIEHLENMPSVQPTLYGYQIEHLAYIARVMEKEGVTAEYATKTFEDIGRAVRMIIEEAQQKAEEMLKAQIKRGQDEQKD